MSPTAADDRPPPRPGRSPWPLVLPALLVGGLIGWGLGRAGPTDLTGPAAVLTVDHPGPAAEAVDALRRVPAAVRSRNVLDLAIHGERWSGDPPWGSADPPDWLADRLWVAVEEGRPARVRIGVRPGGWGGPDGATAARLANAVARVYLEAARSDELRDVTGERKRFEQRLRDLQDRLKAARDAAERQARAVGRTDAGGGRPEALAALYRERTELRLAAVAARAAGGRPEAAKVYADELAAADERVRAAEAAADERAQGDARVRLLEQAVAEAEAAVLRAEDRGREASRVRLVEEAYASPAGPGGG